MAEDNSLAFAEGCNKHLGNCRARNLREGTINHDRKSYVPFAKFFGRVKQTAIGGLLFQEATPRFRTLQVKYIVSSNNFGNNEIIHKKSRTVFLR